MLAHFAGACRAALRGNCSAKRCQLRLVLSLTGVALLLLGVVIYGWLRPPVAIVDIEHKRISSIHGSAFTARLNMPYRLLFSRVGDSLGAPNRSGLVLFEDGMPLGPSHAEHASIAAEGGGAYSHWRRALIFSSSDGSDPRSNGRRYHVEYPYRLRTPLLVLLVGAALAALTATAVLSARSDSPFLRRLWLAIPVLLVLLVLLFQALAPSVRWSLSPSSLHASEGFAYQGPVNLQVDFPYALPGNSVGWPTQSSLILTEDGNPLGPSHEPIQSIEDHGAGRYSHWGSLLTFSASDNSDPRTNGRSYVVEGTAVVTWPVLWAPAIATIIALFAHVVSVSPQRRRALISGVDGQGKILPALLIVLVVIITLSVLVGNWLLARTPSVAAAGFLPLTDALAYWTCAAELAATGGLTQYIDVCGGRVTYTSILASLLGMTNWHLHGVYILQALLAALAAAALTLQSARITGILGGIFVGALLIGYASDHVVGVTMTEVPGFVLGTASLVLLLSGARRRKFVLVLGGLAVFAVAQVARSGAMLILPALWAWTLLCAPSFGWTRRRAAIAAAAALVAGSAFQFTLTRALELDPSASFGNFSTVLYGLSRGGAGWGQIYKDHPELFIGETVVGGEPQKAVPSEFPPDKRLADVYHQIYQIALQRIVAEPQQFASAYAKQAQDLWRWAFDFGPIPPAFWPALKLLMMLGLLRAVIQWRSPVSMLLLAWMLGEALSGPLIVNDGGLRIFASSIGGRAVATAYGLSWILALLFVPARLRMSDTRSMSSSDRAAVTLAGFSAAAILILAAMPAANALGFARLAPIYAAQCPSGQISIVGRLGREAAGMVIVAPSAHTKLAPLRVNKDDLIAGMNSAWFRSDFEAVPSGTLLVTVFNRDQATSLRTAGVAIEKPPNWVFDHTVQVCASPTDFFEVAGRLYLRARSVVLIDEP
jgi:hypothetical protein